MAFLAKKPSDTCAAIVPWDLPQIPHDLVGVTGCQPFPVLTLPTSEVLPDWMAQAIGWLTTHTNLAL